MGGHAMTDLVWKGCGPGCDDEHCTCNVTPHNRVPTLEQIVQALRDKDCPYLGNYKLGYDAALDDVLEETRRAT